MTLSKRATPCLLLLAALLGLLGACGGEPEVPAPTPPVAPAPAVRLAFLSAPSAGVAGAPFEPAIEVELLDADGSRQTSATIGVQLSISGGAEDAQPGGTLVVRSEAGVARFPGVTVNRSGTGYRFLATAEELEGTVSEPFDVAHAPAAHLQIEGLPAEVQAGETATCTVVVTDAFGNVATGYRGTIALASSDPAAVLPDPHTFAEADAGRHTFTLELRRAGDQQLSVEDADDANLSDALSIQVTAAAPARLAFAAQPEDGTVRAPLAAPVVAVLDAFDNLAPVSEPAITLSLSGGNPASILSGSASVAPEGGQATFSELSVDEEGTGFVLVAEAPGLEGATSEPFTVVDDLPPAAPSLALGGVEIDRITLTWTAVGDDGHEGIATGYLLRYAPFALDSESALDQASIWPTSAPKPPGSAESVTIDGLTHDTTYHFALQVEDGAGNQSPLATLEVRTLRDPCAEVICLPPGSVCAADGISLTRYTSACVVVDGEGRCEDTPQPEACPGDDAVCFEDACTSAPAPVEGEVFFNEVMHSPSAGTTEYVELLNASGGLRNLAGLTLAFTESASTSSVTLGTDMPLLMAPGALLVLGQTAGEGSNGGVPVDFAYGEAFTLGTAGTLALLDGESEVEQLVYTHSFPQTPGRAMSVSSRVAGTLANQHRWYWCDAAETLPGGDRGSPGAGNGTCGFNPGTTIGWCNIQSPRSFGEAVPAGSAHDVLGRVWAGAITSRNLQGNDFYPHLEAQLGWGANGANAAGWTWVPAGFNPLYSVGTSSEDEMVGTLSIPIPGTYFYGYRMRLFRPATGTYSDWQYCDVGGPADSSAGLWGTITVHP